VKFPEQFTGRVVALLVDDVDTDQIIPARYLKVTDKAGLGQALFADWRGPDFALDRPEAKGAEILLVGKNFGCGSSREHAPWALVAAGFRAVVARSFADIFRNNALKNGLLPIALADADCAQIGDGDRLGIDLVNTSVTLPTKVSKAFAIDPFAQKCLLSGQDELAYLLSMKDRIEAHEASRAERGEMLRAGGAREDALL
jgi:3-isopropylmalate/(R)-2-methylmalate dehydratase small subunit